MSDLSITEKRALERLFGMGTGYVLDFSDRTFREFVADSTGRDVYDERYNHGSGSKANRLRGFWTEESNGVVGKLLGDLIDHGVRHGGYKGIKKDHPDLEQGRRIVTRLQQDKPVPEVDVLSPASNERDFEIVAKAVRDAIERNELETGLDRLHTFVIKYVRALCEKRGMDVDRNKPLHSVFGDYVKRLRSEGRIESEMASRILRSNISILDAFNDVRNNRSLAHDNPVLSYEEALLIFNHVTALMRFMRNLGRE